ncbi:hypothetical protein HanHA300_Chr11g0396691 [Helianthus annuus]|nr:hypothetical protein HanHA300_Chr11g0396691 [Helianthus annuus]KAJ0516976.1 hypothetical protein HanHA89_Chr11g0420001 [Helianthus annuus]KAJ0684984.1 hypothetical protein HanLR1_Chr11g0397411 [Helianthus annuus]KAJ0688911.1 hypothetical protein HanOQP8_Chr11g0399631 [Helianthus annuus]
MKNSAAKLDNTRYHRNWLTAARSRGLGIGGCDRRWYQSYATGSSQRSVLLTLKF